MKESYVTESGMPVHVIVDALSVVGRLNPMQFDELALNDMAVEVVNRMKLVDKDSDKMKILMDFIKDINKDDYKNLREYVTSLNEKQRHIFLEKVMRNGINIQQDPIDCVDINDIERLYDKYPARKERIVFGDGTRSLRKVIVAPQYFYRLKQDPIEKYSIRGRGNINPISNLPSKSNDSDLGFARHSNVAVKLGIYELELLLMCKNPAAVAAYMAVHCTSDSAREQTAMLYNEPIDKHNIKDFMSKISDRKKNREIIEANLAALSVDIEIEYKDNPNYNKVTLERKGQYLESKF